MSKHETVPVRVHSDGTIVPIDTKIAPLIKALNERGWWTISSCESNSGLGSEERVWVCFGQALGAEYFLELCAKHSVLTQSVRDATCHEYDALPKEQQWECENRWWIEAHPDFSGDLCSISISLRFPKEHLQYVMEMLSKEA